MIKHKLDPAKVYQTDVDKPETKLLSPCLFPSAGFQKLLLDESLEWFANKWAKQGWGNFMRLFASGNWEPKLKLWKPYKRYNKKFHLTEKNPKHYEKLWRRAGSFAERDIFPIITLEDGASLHWDRPGFWRTHWMNGNNNINSTHTSWHSITHCEEHLDDPLFRATYDFQNEKFEYILLEAKRYLGRFFGIEIINEGDARTNYHRRLRKMCNKTLKQGNLDRRIFTSMLRENEFFYARPASNVQQYCIRVLHNVKDFEAYENRKYIFGNPPGIHMVSQDGKMPFKTKKETKREVLKILRSESIGYEGNLRPILELHDGDWINVGYDADWTLRSLDFKLFRGYAKAFDLYLEGE